MRAPGRLADQEFPLGSPTNQHEVLKIGPEILENLPMDRVIRHIQTYRKVYSERLHPLLCALTSADKVAYKDQRESGSGIVAGKFQSMLVDIFGRSFPEKKFWAVDRSAVIRYRQKVIANVRNLERVLYALL